MSFTRFRDDDVRVEEQLHKSTYLGKYQLNKPGPGSDIPFMNDPQIRLEKFGANLRTNTVDLESDFRGLNHKLINDKKELKEFVLSQESFKVFETKVCYIFLIVGPRAAKEDFFFVLCVL